MTATQQFYSAYGEFFAVWKLWNRLEHDCKLNERQWELHKRAAAAEALIEGILVKLASELALDQQQVATLGRFRQGFQLLRQAIRQNLKLNWTYSEQPEYQAFKELATKVAALLTADWSDKPPTGEQAAVQLLKITSNNWEKNWVHPSGVR